MRYLFLLIFFVNLALGVNQLKEAIEKYDVKKIENILNQNPKIVNSEIDGKLVLDYVLDKGFNLLNSDFNEIYESDQVLEKEYSDIKDIKGINQISLILEILNLLEKYGSKSGNPLKYTVEKLEFDERAPEKILYLKKSLNIKNEEILSTLRMFVDYLTRSINKAINLIKNDSPERKLLVNYINLSDTEDFALIISLLVKIIVGEFTSDSIVLKSILLGEACKGCNKDNLYNSLEWKVYTIAKEQRFFALVGLIRDLALLEKSTLLNKERGLATKKNFIPSEIVKNIKSYWTGY